MAKEKIDMIVLGLINNFLYSLVDEMTIGVVRTSFSPLTRDAFDFLAFSSLILRFCTSL